jgi:hypothetical protein
MKKGSLTNSRIVRIYVKEATLHRMSYIAGTKDIFSFPMDIVSSLNDKIIYVADTYNHRIASILTDPPYTITHITGTIGESGMCLLICRVI